MGGVVDTVAKFIGPAAALSGFGLPLSVALGAGGGLLSGGGLKGALAGGLGGASLAGGGSLLGSALGAGLGAAGDAALGSGLLGAGAGGLSGGAKGALLGGAAGGLGGYAGAGGFDGTWAGDAYNGLTGGLNDAFDTAGNYLGGQANSVSNSLGGGDLFGAGSGSTSGVTASGVTTGAVAPSGMSSYGPSGDGWASEFSKLGTDTAGSSYAAAAPVSGDISGFPNFTDGSIGFPNFSENISKGVSNVAAQPNKLSSLLGMANSAYTNYKANDALQEANKKGLEALSPFMQSGSGATNRLSDLLGLSGNSGAEGYGSLAKQFDPSQLENDPSYQFTKNQGLEAINAQLAAKGQLNSGGAQKAIADYTTGLANQTINDRFNQYLQGNSQQYSQLAGLGDQGLKASGAASGLYENMGQSSALSGINTGNTINRGLSALLGGTGAYGNAGQDLNGGTVNSKDSLLKLLGLA